MRLKGRLDPVQGIALDGHHIKATRRRRLTPQQEVAGCEHDASSLHMPHTGRSTPLAALAALPHLDKHQGLVGREHDQVDLAAPSTGGSIIAGDQVQALPPQEAQGLMLSPLAPRSGRDR